MAQQDWKMIESGLVYPFIIVYQNRKHTNIRIRAGILKVSGNLGQDVIWRVDKLSYHVLWPNNDDIIRLFYKDFSGSKVRDRALRYLQKYMNTHTK